MRIIAGKAKGRQIKGPAGLQTRAVLDQVKEAIFNILFDVTDLSVLDLFAGTGSIGLEAISRGAKKAVFVENDRRAIDIIRENIERCGFKDHCRIVPLNTDRALKKLRKTGEKFDLIFIDPPYLKDFVMPTIKTVSEFDFLTQNGKIVIEHHPKEPVENLPTNFRISDQRKYGQTSITFICRGFS